MEPAPEDAAPGPAAEPPRPERLSWSSPTGLLDGIVARWERLDAIAYWLFAATCVLYAACTFYGSMHHQTRGVWSAPLDDVFIHFDYARATARGYPFQWSEGNGFSSGNTSLAYPFVLALGYWVGFRDQGTASALMLWAAIVACVSTLVFFAAAKRLTEPLGRWAKYLIPPAILSLGALDWSLFSGMENAFHLGVWGVFLVTALAVGKAAGAPIDRALAQKLAARRGWLAGLAGALLFATRPESAICLVTLALYVAVVVRRPLGWGSALASIVRIGLPGVVVMALQALANRWFTSEWAANGAIAKLSLNNPYMTGQEKLDEYLFLLRYVVLRNTQHHFTDAFPWGWLVPLVALVPLFARRTRGLAVVLWVSALGWLAIVALNAQVRWQNERYTMSAVAWILILFAMGIAVILSRAYSEAMRARLGRGERFVAVGRGVLAVAIAASFWWHQIPNMRDQIWFFGRASRNIHDQHLAMGDILHGAGAKRILVGDAGAILYAADRPGLDLIGLGGYHDLPFARAGVHGLGASLELLERMPPSERPDVMAIYPSWWGDLPTLFGRRLTEVKVFGNVICGGAEKVLYKADWSALDKGGKPRGIRPGEALVDEVDVADLVSEKAHHYRFPQPSMGFVDFRLLGDPIDSKRDLFDAGRVIPQGQVERAHVKLPRAGGGRLIVRTAVGQKTRVEVRVDGQAVGTLELRKSKGWSEPSIDLPGGLPEEAELTLAPLDGTFFDCHVWIVGSAP